MRHLHRLRRQMRTAQVAALIVTVAVSCAAGATERSAVIRLAMTTSAENSELLEYLLPEFEARSGLRIRVIAVGTDKALRMSRDGDLDALLVHAPGAEKTIMAACYGRHRAPVMFNDFVIVGPADDPAGVSGVANATDALRHIADQEAVFDSRRDDSGTHKRELRLWSGAGYVPHDPWCREAGQGRGRVLQIASEMQAYTLTGRGTWLAHGARLD